MQAKRKLILQRLLKLFVVAVCMAGFLYQTMQFMNLYWTYPTVVDIQVTVPSEIDLPGITFCNTNGIIPSEVCNLGSVCADSFMLQFVDICDFVPNYCEPSKTLPEDFKMVSYDYLLESGNLNASVMYRLRKPINDIVDCNITSPGRTRKCNLDDHVWGSYYSDSNIFNFCFTINTLWSAPNKKVEKIQKSERIQMRFHADISDRDKNAPFGVLQYPKYNYPSLTPSIQLLVHSPYLTASPFLSGVGLLGGKIYQINLKETEKHLLTHPYQTNCTDYLPMWKARNGTSPLTPMMAIEECKLNASLAQLQCVPVEVDYPHNETVCKVCHKNEKCKETMLINHNCTELLATYNQPCDFVSYEMRVEEKLVYIEKNIKKELIYYKETIVEKVKGYNCSFEKCWARECQTIDVDIVFDDFEVTNLTYNAKFESLEVFSVIGGYMGMYLGFSIVTVYNFADVLVKKIYELLQKKRKEKRNNVLKTDQTPIDRMSNSSAYEDHLRHRRKSVMPINHGPVVSSKSAQGCLFGY